MMSSISYVDTVRSWLWIHAEKERFFVAVRFAGDRRTFYLSRIEHGEYRYSSDVAHARAFTAKTAQKHAQTIMRREMM